jgi:hypothetical protein
MTPLELETPLTPVQEADFLLALINEPILQQALRRLLHERDTLKEKMSKLEEELAAANNPIEVEGEGIHYAPYGRFADGSFHCGSKKGGWSQTPAHVTCEGCKRKSPGIWPEHKQ